MSDTNGMAEWVRRVLAVDVTKQLETADPAEIWRDAKDTVDEQLNKLAERLRKTGDVDLIRIADFGLFGITAGGGANVALAKALLQYRGAAGAGRGAAADGVRKAVDGYRSVVQQSAVVRLIDKNPFGVPASVAATLGQAFDRIERAVA